MSVKHYTGNRSDHAQQHMWAAVVLMAVNDAFGDMWDRTELDRAEALRFLLSPRGAWARSREEVCSCAGAEPDRLHAWALSVMDGKTAYGDPKSVQASRDLWASINAPREKPKPTEKDAEQPAPDAGAIPLPSIVETYGVFDVRDDGTLVCPNSRPLAGPNLPRENSQQGRVLKALTMQRGGTINSLRKAYAKWEQVAVELCRRLDLEMIYRHDGHEVEGIIDAETKVFVRRRRLSHAA